MLAFVLLRAGGAYGLEARCSTYGRLVREPKDIRGKDENYIRVPVLGGKPAVHI